MDQYLRNSYLEQNSRHRRLFVYHLEGKGLFLELRRMANGMIYAANNGLQFVIESSRFAYKYRDGWSDYFEPICRLYAPEMERDVARHFWGRRPSTEDDRKLMGEVFWCQADRIRIGTLTIEPLDEIKRLFAMLLFKLNRETQRRVDAIIEALDLPETYVALQIRRGEKLINGEGEYRGGELYIERLQSLSAGTGIFVMSDDYTAVREVEAYVSRRGLPNRVYSLVPPELAGIHFAQYIADPGGKDPADYIYEETLRLLAETTIVTQSDQFVGAADTNVALGLFSLHPNPNRCILLA